MLPTHLVERLDELSQQQNATLFMTMLAAFKVLLPVASNPASA